MFVICSFNFYRCYATIYIIHRIYVQYRRLNLNKDSIQQQTAITARPDCLECGDCIIIQVIQASGLIKVKNNIPNPYCCLQYGSQLQVGTVRKNTINPQFNETFGFHIDMVNGAAKIDLIRINLYDYDFTTQKQSSLGKYELKMNDIPLNKQLNCCYKLCGGTGDLFVSMYRSPISSPQLTTVLKVEFTRVCMKFAGSDKIYYSNLKKIFLSLHNVCVASSSIEKTME